MLRKGRNENTCSSHCCQRLQVVAPQVLYVPKHKTSNCQSPVIMIHNESFKSPCHTFFGILTTLGNYIEEICSYILFVTSYPVHQSRLTSLLTDYFPKCWYSYMNILIYLWNMWLQNDERNFAFVFFKSQFLKVSPLKIYHMTKRSSRSLPLSCGVYW